MGAGTSSGKASSGAYASAASKYQSIADSNNAKSAANQGNLTYKLTADLYSGLAKAAKTMPATGTRYSGAKAVVALDNAPIGTTVEIKGNILEGRYQLQNVNNWWTNGTQPAWVALDAKNHNHAFAKTPGAISSELGYPNKKTSKVKIV